MANSNNMYGANLKEYALEILKNKQIARSTITLNIIERGNLNKIKIKDIQAK
jgi:hypothetical protein